MRFLPLSLGFGALSLVALVSTPIAHAQVTGFNSLTAFNAAANTSGVYGFEGLAAPGNIYIVPPPPIAPLTVTLNNGQPYFVTSGT